MIRAEVIADFKEINAWGEFLEAYPALANETVQDAFNAQIKEPMLAELRHTPGQVKHPVEWQSEKQRRAYFASDGFGQGIPYRRTGKMVQGWKADVQIFEGDAVMSVSNPSKTLRYVTGERQQRMHIATGWQPHKPTIEFWANAAAEVVLNAIRRLFGERP